MMIRSTSATIARRLRLRRLVQLLLAAAAIYCALALYMSYQLPISDNPILDTLAAVPSQQFCSREHPPMVCAHGGDTKSAPPNTEASFTSALLLGVDCVEIDVARTKDDQLVVLHARELSQLRGGTQGEQVADFTWEELQQLRWPGGQGVVLVEAAVRLVQPAVQRALLDLKPYLNQDGSSRDEARLAELVVSLLRRTPCPQCVVWAKSDSLVASVKRMLPAQPCGYVVLQPSPEARRLGLDKPLRLAASMQALGAYHKLASPQLLERAHRRGLQLYVWTVNSAEAIRAALEVAVDAIITNEPELVQRAVENLLVACRAADAPEQDALL